MKRTASQPFKQYRRIFSLILIAWASTGPVGSISARSPKLKDQPDIIVGVYNYAEIAPQELLKAERQAAALFARSGVRIAWLEYSHKASSVPAPSDDPPADLFVRILCAPKIRRARRVSRADVMGVSFLAPGPAGEVPGRITNVFYDQVKKLSAEWGQFSGEVLGEAIAHELGHLLLGPRHSHQGIMKATWTFRDQLLMNRCQMGFSRPQAELLQRAAHSLERNRQPMLAALR